MTENMLQNTHWCTQTNNQTSKLRHLCETGCLWNPNTQSLTHRLLVCRMLKIQQWVRHNMIMLYNSFLPGQVLSSVSLQSHWSTKGTVDSFIDSFFHDVWRMSSKVQQHPERHLRFECMSSSICVCGFNTSGEVSVFMTYISVWKMWASPLKKNPLLLFTFFTKSESYYSWYNHKTLHTVLLTSFAQL